MIEYPNTSFVVLVLLDNIIHFFKDHQTDDLFKFVVSVAHEFRVPEQLAFAASVWPAATFSSVLLQGLPSSRTPSWRIHLWV